MHGRARYNEQNEEDEGKVTKEASGCGGLTEGQEGGCVRHGGGGLSFGVKRSLRRTIFFGLLQLLALLHVRVSKQNESSRVESTGPLSPNSSTALCL